VIFARIFFPLLQPFDTADSKLQSSSRDILMDKTPLSESALDAKPDQFTHGRDSRLLRFCALFFLISRSSSTQVFPIP